LGVTIIASLLVFVIADNQTDLNPNCDLVSVSHVNVNKNGNGSLDIDMSWDRKIDNYAKLGNPIKAYVVRHGPMDGDDIVDNSSITMMVDMTPDTPDAVNLKNVQPCEKYGIQICAVTTSFQFLFRDDAWKHAWTGSMGLSDYGTQPDDDDTSKSIESDDQSDESATPAPTSTQSADISTILPQCDLVGGPGSSVNLDVENSDTLTVHFGWTKKLSSYESFGSIDHYQVRYGPTKSFGSPIDESDALYMEVDASATSFSLPNVPRQGYYALQFCAMPTADNDPIDWKNQAWLGGMNFTTYDAYAGWIRQGLDLESTTNTVTAMSIDTNVVIDDSDDDSDDSNRLTQNLSLDGFPMISQPILGSNNGILILVIASIAITICIAAGIGLIILRKRRSAKTAPMYIVTTGKPMMF